MSDVDWHREMLGDRARVRRFVEAVRAAVRPGDVVLDLGTGSGILGFAAARAGAARVYAIDRGHIITVAEQLAQRNGVDDRIRFMRGASRELELPERVDVIVAEIIGAFGLEEEIVESLADARQRFLKPGGRMLPDRLELWVAPTAEGFGSECWYHDLLEDWDLDFAELRDMSRHIIHTTAVDPAHFLAPPQQLLGLDLHTAAAGQAHGQVEATLAAAGTLTGFAGWFTAFSRDAEILNAARSHLA